MARFPGFSWNSAHTLYAKLKEMTADLQRANAYAYINMAKQSEFWYPGGLVCIKYSLRRQSYGEGMLWSQVTEFDDPGKRVHLNMHSANCWWYTQAYTCCDFAQ